MTLTVHPRTLLDDALAELHEDSTDADVLAAPLSDDEWSAIERAASAISVEGQRAIDRLSARITANRRVYILGPMEKRPRRRRRRTPRVGNPLRRAREETLAQFLALYVEEHPEDRWGVHAFRTEVVGNPTLSAGVAERWIQRQARMSTPRERTSSLASERVTMLSYVSLGSAWVQRVIAPPRTPLERLAKVSERVASFTGWHPARVTMFVLTGECPYTPAIAGHVEWKFPLAARSRVVLRIDPSCPPREVAEAYRALRRQHFRPIRRLTRPHAQLALFATQHAHLTVAEQMDQWNARRGPGPRYRKPSVFQRACRQAVARLTELRTDLPRP